MLTTKRRKLMNWLGFSPRRAPLNEDHPLETVPVKLTARVVARRIRYFLDGGCSRSQLSDWAVSQFVKQDFSHWFEPPQQRVLREAISALIPVDEAIDAAKDRLILERLADSLDAEP